MKRSILITLFVILLMPINVFSANSNPQIDFGLLIQDGYAPAFCYGGTVTFPIMPLTREPDQVERHYLGVQPEIMYVERDGVEMYIGKSFILYERPIFTVFSVPFNMGIGTGIYVDMKSDGNDESKRADKLMFGVQAEHFNISLIAEHAAQEGPDMFVVGLSIRGAF